MTVSLPTAPRPRVLVVQHTAVCPPARVGDWLTAAGCALDVVPCFAGRPLPADLGGHDALVVLGGEMGAYDDVAHPWLTPTKDLLREAVAVGLPTLAVCLGHQLLAVACGGAVEPSPLGQQIGLEPWRATDAAADDLLVSALPADATTVHWNNDVVTALPPAAVALATTAAGVEAFRLGPAAWSVQFHPEVDAGIIGVWADADVATGWLDRDVAAWAVGEIAAADDAVRRTGAALTRAFAGRITARLAR